MRRSLPVTLATALALAIAWAVGPVHPAAPEPRSGARTPLPDAGERPRVGVKKRAPRGRRKRGARRKKPSLPPARVAGEIPSTRVSPSGRHHDWPAIAVTADGAAWVASVEWNGKDADRVVVRRRAPDGTWQEPVGLADGCWDHHGPAIAARGDEVVVVWSGQKDGNFDLYGARVGAAGPVAEVERLTNAPLADFHVRAASDGRGGVTIVWQSLRSGRSDIYARRLRAAGGWGPEVRISPSEANDWEPAVALDGTGRAWIVWDGYARGNYDVFLRSWDGEHLGEVVDVTRGPEAQFHATVALDAAHRVWVAWDEGCTNWGKDLSASSRVEGNDGLHGSRRIGLRVLADGRLWTPAADLSKVLTGRMRRYAELPARGVDGGGSVWLVFRHWTITRPTEMYHVYATRLAADGWTLPWRLASSSGRNAQHAALARDRNGDLLVAYASDGRAPDNLPRDQIHALLYQVYVAALERRVAPEGPALLPSAPPPAPETRFVRRRRYTTRIGGRRYTLLYGDCHRHTDIRGHSGVDGSILDTFRYAYDAAQLDFMGFGDHNEVCGGRWPDGLRDYSWWYTQKLIDLHHAPPTFVGVYSYEHSMARPAGHRNMIFLRRGAPLRPIDRAGGVEKPDNQPPNLWKWVREKVLTQPGQKVVIVPHTFAAGPLADWNWPNAEFDCLLEIYQGCRGSYEAWNLPRGERRGGTQTRQPGHFARDALAKGNRYGFVSFSDHRSTHNSFAGVWVEAIRREAIIDAMLARRTFAASDEIVLDVRAGDHAMGEGFVASSDAPPPIEVYARAPDAILRVDVIKDGAYVYTTRPGAREVRFRFEDRDAKPGPCSYYVRLFQRDPEAPEGDPEVAWASPFFVRYRP